MSELVVSELKEGWKWKQLQGESVHSLLARPLDSSNGWTDVHSMPSEIHLELLHQKRIPDPYIGFNEHSIQWVGEAEWLYACNFTINKYLLDEGRQAELRFDGLDTFCNIYLNGKLLLQTENMFHEHLSRLDVDLLKDENTLVLHFESAKLRAKELEKKYGRVRAGSVNLGDPSRVYVRKAQYGWRWDWGPEIMTVGPWRPIWLTVYSVHLDTVHISAEVSSDLKPSLSVSLSVEGTSRSAYRIVGRLRNGDSQIIREEEFDIGPSVDQVEKNLISSVWNLDGLVDLWWPVGYGKAMLYNVEVELVAEDGLILDRCERRIGFRHVQLLQHALTEGDRYGTGIAFCFAINNTRIFMGGSNWIPADNFLPSITPDRYRAWLTLLRNGNQNMVRVWGGGVYEPDVFYDICDELGLLVWQDFQFACGIYPAHPEFLDLVKVEADLVVKRLRNHPSLTLFCGNNEDYQQILQWEEKPELPARIIYEEILPNVVEKLMGCTVPYWRASPYGGKGWDTADPTIGDIHSWDIWGGKERPYQEYDSRGGRFVSEFGIPASPDVRTVQYWMDGLGPAIRQMQQYSQSAIMQQHNKAGVHERRMAILMNDNFRLTSDFESHVFLTQVLQSEAVGFAYRSWRREWRGSGKEYVSLIRIFVSHYDELRLVQRRLDLAGK